MNDHCLLPNLLAYKDTTRACARHSCSLSFVPQEMSLNIDMNRILPVKCSSPNLLSKSLTLQKCIDIFPPPLLLSVPWDNGLVARKTGFPLSLNLIIINSAMLSLSPCGLSIQVEYHFISDPGPRKDQRPAGNLFAKKDTSVALALHSRSLSSDHHMMSLTST